MVATSERLAAPARTCAACRDPIAEDADPRRRYCSRVCLDWQRRHPGETRVRRPCERCGELLALNARPERRWCSQRCKDAPRRDPRRDELERFSTPPDDDALDADLVPWLMVPDVTDPTVAFVPPAWWREAACSGMPTSTFVGNAGYASSAAVEVCQGCPVRDQCLEYALADPDLYAFGVFGGATPRERRAIGRARGLATSPLEVAEPKPEVAPRQLAACGTEAAYRRHERRREECATCGIDAGEPNPSTTCGCNRSCCPDGCSDPPRTPGSQYSMRCQKRRRRRRGAAA